MIELNIPGRGSVQLEHLVCDVNGTLAVDGILLDRIPKILSRLSDRLSIHLLTANTHGKQEEIDRLLGLQAVILKPGNESGQKETYVRNLGAESTAAVGQGTNDAGMLRAAAIGICLLSREGLAGETLAAADIFVPDIYAALDLFEKPMRLVATLRK